MRAHRQQDALHASTTRKQAGPIDRRVCDDAIETLTSPRSIRTRAGRCVHRRRCGGLDEGAGACWSAAIYLPGQPTRPLRQPTRLRGNPRLSASHAAVLSLRLPTRPRSPNSHFVYLTVLSRRRPCSPPHPHRQPTCAQPHAASTTHHSISSRLAQPLRLRICISPPTYMRLFVS